MTRRQAASALTAVVVAAAILGATHARVVEARTSAARSAPPPTSGIRRSQPAPSVVGFWNTISDEDGRPEAVVEIRKVGDEYDGVVRALLVAAGPQDSVCGKCSGDLKGKPVVGMEIVRHMHASDDPNEWSGGEILDPESGKTYRAKMTLADGGRKLVVRGYIGLPIFGRSQTWLRRTAAP